MKSIYTYIFTFICFFSLYTPLAAGIQEISEKPSSDQGLLALASILNDMTFSTLVHVMYDLENSIDYWQGELKNRYTYKFFNQQKANLAAKQHLEYLKKAEKVHVKALGNLHILRHTKNLSASEYCAKSLNILSGFTNIPTFDDKSDFENLQARLSAAINNMSTYKKSFNTEICVHVKPSHFARNWWKYLLGAAAISAVGLTAYEFKGEIPQWYQQGIEILQRQWQQRIVEPIGGIINNLSLKSYGSNQKELEEIRQDIEKLQADNNHTSEIYDIKKEGLKKETYTYYQRRPDIQQHEIDALVDSYLQCNDTDVMHDFAEQMRNIKDDILPIGRNEVKRGYHKFIENLPNWLKSWLPTPTPEEQEQEFRLFETAFQLFNLYKVEKADKKELLLQKFLFYFIKLFYEVKQQWYLQEVNAMFGAMFPAALTGYAAYKISSYTFTTLFFKKVILIPLQERILSIRKMLNRFDDGEQKQLSDEMTGYLVYWTHKLRQYIIQIPDEQQENFKQDIQELESTQLTIKQKHEVVKRMYDIYGFLRFSE